MNNKSIGNIQRIVQNLSKLPYVYAIIMFGSQVNGNKRKDSDVDIAILTKKINKNQEIKIFGYSSEVIDISIFNKLPLIIQFRVLKDGKILYCKDKNYLHEVKYQVIRKYLDFSSFINQFYGRVIKKV